MTRTLVVRLDSAGDVLLAGPAVRAVAASSAYVAVLCGPQGAPAAELLPGVDRTIVWEAPWAGFDPPPVDPEDVRALAGDLARQRFDRAVLLTSFHQSPLPTALVLRLAGVPAIAADCEDYPGSLLDLRHRRAPGRHEAEAALDLARAAGFPLPPHDDGRLRVLPPPDLRHLTGPDPYVVVHPGAAVPARAAGPAVLTAAVRALAEAGRRVVVTGSPAEKELTAEVAGAHALDLGGRTDLRGLSAVLAEADAVVAGNTGPAHLAAAVGTPVVSLFSPVVPAERWRPFGVPHLLLGRQDAPCAASRARVCPVAGHPCLNTLTGAQIAAAVGRLTSGAVPGTDGPHPPARPSTRKVSS
ncbi:glycosyltransferase family 9 protein [Kitasatospora sp. NPDC015120]|uniref:glycosyltransferase family 9 protein n=1 Tax=Kitasatospora sp. NPDC015120 TaxID=3364023 RepID=UPI0036F4863C